MLAENGLADIRGDKLLTNGPRLRSNGGAESMFCFLFFGRFLVGIADEIYHNDSTFGGTNEFGQVKLVSISMV